ncbi:hypothetical protein Asulf_01709 [Archaeoglobus sulfaticallidus PM70-1]|uniref:Peptidase U32 n=1 Tax=Archaeoglobus sulfaticallidus PM70-1 TaxID=387631 RepID=N0BN12_9EURY|nr:U32 family peptidase [Archaeoglobus sulfaticallidus]AGK61680.1 hypothetical protein Asulf_01709 [Archaeoglobus sulfaticallidus PM70-1]
MQVMSPDIRAETVYVGLRGFSRYSDKNALSIDEINELSKDKNVFVALNRIRGLDPVAEVVEVIERLKCKGVILNDAGLIWKVSVMKNKKKIVSSVGLNPLNELDIEFLKSIGADVVVIPPELNSDISIKKDVEIEAFGFALIEMFYKGKCMISSYFNGISTKKSGLCTKKCCRRWKVVFEDKEVCEVSFNPKAVMFEFDERSDFRPDYVKLEGRQFRRFDDGAGNQHPDA